MTPDQYRIAQEEELQAAAPIGNAPVAIPAPPLPEVPPYMPRGYSSRADEAAAAAAEQDRASKDSEAKVADARSLINKAFGGSAGDLAAPIRATREDGIKDITRRRLQEDQDRARAKEQHDALEQEALSKGDSPESQKRKDFFSSTIVGKRLRASMGEEAWARLPGGSVPGVKEQVSSDTELLKSTAKPLGNPEDDFNSPASKSAQLGYSIYLKNHDPKQYAAMKEQIPLLSAKAIQQLSSSDLRAKGLDQPAVRLLIDTNTGNQISYDRKHPGAPGLPGTLAPGEEAPPGENPKERHERRKKLLDLGAPPADFKWSPKVLSGEVPPPAKQEVDAANKVTTAAATATDFGQRLLSFLDKHPNGSMLGDDATAAKTWGVGIQTMVRAANDMGVYRAYDQPIIDEAYRNPTELRNILLSAVGARDLRVQLKSLMDEMRQRSWSLQQQAQRVVDENGRLKDFQPVSAGAAGAGGGHTWVKDQRNKATGEVRGVYSSPDGQETYGPPHGS